MNTEQRAVLRKIIYAVETGGQVYGKCRYDDFTEAYTNSELEHAITIGAGQWYGNEGLQLLKRIKSAGGEGFTDELLNIMSMPWTTLMLKKSSSAARAIVQVITTPIGILCQDQLLDEQMDIYIKESEALGVTEPDAQAMCANFRHQGGYGAMKRILSKTSRPYTLDNLYQATLSDTGNQVGAYRTRQRKVYEWLKKYMPKEGKKAVTKTVEQVRKSALDWMLNLARDDSHGYSQDNRWGPDYDCSSAIITAFKQAGVPLTCTYTGNMYDNMYDNGFQDVTSQVNLVTGEGLQPSDVLLNVVHHTAMYVGNGQEVEASINEKGGAHGGKTGDQTGREILVRPYRNYPWDYVLRYGKTEPAKVVPTKTFTVEQVQMGDKNQSVWLLRTILRGRSYKTSEGTLLKRGKVFDSNTLYCVKKFQEKNGLEVDGIVGKLTWSKLTGFTS